MPKMSSGDLKALLAGEKADALSAVSASKLSDERARALDYYMGEMERDLPAAEGRSRAVSSDVADTIEGLMPSLVEIFTAGDEVVKFDAVGPEDVAAAERETDYVNHVFMQHNPGFLVLYSFIKDALLSKVGVVKVWWEKREERERETYLDLDEASFAIISADPEIEIVEHTAHQPESEVTPNQPEFSEPASGPDNAQPQPAELPAGAPTSPPMATPTPPPMLHDVTVETKRNLECARVEGVPPEEFGIARHARSIRDADYCFHDVLKSQSKLIAQGYDAEQIKRLPTFVITNTIESQARDTVREGTLGQGDALNEASRLIRITEHYVRMAYDTGTDDKSSEARLYRVTTGGEDGEVLLRDGQEDVIEEDAIPFAAMTPVIITHRFFGRSIADLVMDIQRIKTAVLRGLLDNVYMSNMPRPVLAEEDANENTLDDLLVARHGAPIRVKRNAQTAVSWQSVPDVTGHVFPTLQYLDATREWRTGVSRQGQGIDPSSLQNQVATIANQMENASQARIKLIARIFAETGIRDLFSLLHGLIRKNGTKAQMVQLRNKWVTIDPRDWKKRDDMTINVGLGTGTKAQQLAHLQLIIGAQTQAVGGGAGIVSQKNLYNSAVELTKLAGHKDSDKFFVAPGQQADQQDPSAAPIQKPPDPKMQIAELKNQHDQQVVQIKQQGEAQSAQIKQQADQQAAQLKAQLDQQKAQADTLHQATKSQGEAALANAKAQLDAQLAVLEHRLKVREAEITLQFEREKHVLEMRHKDQAHHSALALEAFKAAHQVAAQHDKPAQQ